MSVQRYDRIQILMHWLTVALIFGAFALIWLAEDASSALRKDLVTWHRWTGVMILTFTVLRLGWRITHHTPPLNGLPQWERITAIGTHHLLYLLMLAIPLSGWAMSSAFGRQIILFNAIPLPNLVAENPDLGDTIKEIHETLATALMIFVALHAAAGIKHYIIDRDDILQRMLPFLKKRN